SVLFFRILLLPPQSPLFPYTTLFRSPLRRQAQELLAEPGTPGQAVAQVAQPGRLSDPGRIARQVGDKAFAQRHALLPGALMQYLDLHAGHVDAGRASALAALAGAPELKRPQHLVGG